MTVASEITRLQWAKADIKTAIENKWVTVPSSTTLDWYPTLIDSIQTWVPQASYNAMQSLAKIPPYLAWSWWSSSTAASKSLKCWDYYIYILLEIALLLEVVIYFKGLILYGTQNIELSLYDIDQKVEVILI